MLQKFLINVLGQKPENKPDVKDFIFQRNNITIRPASLIVVGVSIYWIIIDLFTDNYNLDIYCKVGVYAQLIMSLIIFAAFSINKKYPRLIMRILYVVYYAIIVTGVFVLILSRNRRIAASGIVNNDIGVSVSAFYLFMMAFMPLPDVIDSIIVLTIMTLGLVLPDLLISTSTYSLFCHVVLSLCFLAIYVYLRLILIENGKHELRIHNLNEELTEHSYCDGLTSILNRRSFDLYLKYLINEAHVGQAGFIFFDIDFFKKFNDYYGHAKGDEVLIKVANSVETYLKQYEQCYLFRYGGEEFVAVISGIDKDKFKQLLIDINQIIYQKNIIRADIGEFDRITITVGGAIENIPNLTNDYITNADNQLYLGKNTKRNCAYFENKSINDGTDSSQANSETNNNYIMTQVLIKLCDNVKDIYSVNCQDRRVTIHRSGGRVIDINSVLNNNYDYDLCLGDYIEKHVHPLDKEKLRKKLDFQSIYDAVRQYGIVSIYYRAILGQATLYYKIKIIPDLTKDTFSSLILAFLPEELDVSKEQIDSILELDDLTGIYTKQAYMHYAKKYIEENSDKQFFTVVSDIENFRAVNNIYGTVQADDVLKFLAKEYSDMENCRVLGRYGGDQFVGLFENNENLDDDKIADLFKNIRLNAPVRYLTVKYGVYYHTNIDEPISAICDKAVLALRNIKHLDRVPFEIYNESIVSKQNREQTLEADFEKALVNKEFKVYVQPKYNAISQTINGAEALIRWIREDGEFISAGEFIPILEKNGTIKKLDLYVFEYICSQQRQIIENGIKPLPISVNVSRSTMFQTNTFNKYKKIIESYGIDKKLVPIEITESWAVESQRIKELVNEIKDTGFELHMDDFGTGYSSLSSLSLLPVDVVKLDKSLIDNIGNFNGDEVIRHIIELAHFLKMEIVGEGVENQKQYDFLKSLNCETIQGYYFAKPMPFEDYLHILK